MGSTRNPLLESEQARLMGVRPVWPHMAPDFSVPKFLGFLCIFYTSLINHKTILAKLEILLIRGSLG
jgi:hypothetical protein